MPRRFGFLRGVFDLENVGSLLGRVLGFDGT